MSEDKLAEWLERVLEDYMVCHDDDTPRQIAIGLRFFLAEHPEEAIPPERLEAARECWRELGDNRLGAGHMLRVLGLLEAVTGDKP